jgi:DinB superfamily
MIDQNRQHWNEQQKALGQALRRTIDHAKAVEIFLSQHAMVYPAAMSGLGLWSFEDEVWAGLSEAAARRVPAGGEHSIVWMVWHATRCEDITMNLLAAGSPQVLNRDGWQERMKISARDTGNAMSPDEIAAFSAAIDIPALRGYRAAVGCRTEEIARQLAPGALKQKVDPACIRQMMAEGAVVEKAQWLIDYWASRTIAGLLMMPATRHQFVHLSEATRAKKKNNTLVSPARR